MAEGSMLPNCKACGCPFDPKDSESEDHCIFCGGTPAPTPSVAHCRYACSAFPMCGCEVDALHAPSEMPHG